MHVVIDAASIDTNVKMRDDHLRSGDFLDVQRFPTLEFYSDRFTHRGGNRWAVTGALSLHGVTRTVTLDAEYLGLGNGMEGEARAACRATTELHRDDFTVSWQDHAGARHRGGRAQHQDRPRHPDRAQGLTRHRPDRPPCRAVSDNGTRERCETCAGAARPRRREEVAQALGERFDSTRNPDCSGTPWPARTTPRTPSGSSSCATSGGPDPRELDEFAGSGRAGARNPRGVVWTLPGSRGLARASAASAAKSVVSGACDACRDGQEDCE